MLVFSVPGMRCGGCARKVAAVLRGAQPGVEIRVDLERRRVAVAGTADADDLAHALHRAGFESERLGA